MRRISPRVFSATPSEPLRAAETVEMERPARSATVLIVTAVVPHGSARSAGSGVHPWTPVEHILSDNTGEHEALLREVIRPHTSLLSGQRCSDIFL